MQQLFRKIILHILRLFTGAPLQEPKFPVADDKIAPLLALPHNCALIALARVLPDLAEKDITAAFIFCCENWPHGGVSNREFNIVLRHLGVIDKFQYCGDDAVIGDLLAQNNRTFVALIYGHYTVVWRGDIIDSPFNLTMGGNEKVYCYWELCSTANW